MSRNIYIVGGHGREYTNWMLADAIVDKMEDADLILFTGGEDISGSIYNKKEHPTTSSNWNRDRYEIEQFRKAQVLELPIIGICRGAQFCGAMSGAQIVQHMEHPYLHPVKTISGDEIIVSSTHHQAQYIKEMDQNDVELIAWAENLSEFHYGESYDDVLDGDKEVEIAYYNKTRCLAIQSHPEHCFRNNEEWAKKYIEYCRSLIVKYLEV